jgi:hypothetical protein
MLGLYHINFGAMNTKSIIEKMPNTIEELHLRRIGAKATGARAIISKLRYLQHIKRLSLEDFTFYQEEAVKLSKFNFTSLAIEDCNLDDVFLHEFNPNNYKSLSLQKGYHYTSNGMNILFEKLRNNSTIECLLMDECANMTVSNANKLFEVLKTMSKIRSIRISNPIVIPPNPIMFDPNNPGGLPPNPDVLDPNVIDLSPEELRKKIYYISRCILPMTTLLSPIYAPRLVSGKWLQVELIRMLIEMLY